MGIYLTEGLQNLLLHSEDFQTWSSANASVIPNLVFAPNSIQMADYVYHITNSAFLDQSIVTSDIENETYTLSIWAKGATSSVELFLSLFTDGASPLDVASAGYRATGAWDRIELSTTFPGSTAQTEVGFQFGFPPAVATGGAYFWGAQLTRTSGKTAYVQTSDTAIADTLVSVEIIPLWNYKEESKKMEYAHRSLNGHRYVYKSGDYDRWKIGVEWLTVDEKDTINNWWKNNTELIFAERDGFAISSVQLVGRASPIGKLVKPYDDQWRGVLEMETY